MGGSKTVFGEGIYGMFSPPLSSPPLFFSDMLRNLYKRLRSSVIQNSVQRVFSGKFRDPGPEFSGIVMLSMAMPADSRCRAELKVTHLR